MFLDALGFLALLLLLLKSPKVFMSHDSCFRVSIAVMRRHDRGNSYKGKTFNGGRLCFFRGLVHYCGVTWWLACKHSSGEVVECPPSWLAGNVRYFS